MTHEAENKKATVYTWKMMAGWMTAGYEGTDWNENHKIVPASTHSTKRAANIAAAKIAADLQAAGFQVESAQI